jgi:hypothetical protein
MHDVTLVGIGQNVPPIYEPPAVVWVRGWAQWPRARS